MILHLVPSSAFEAGSHAALPALATSAPRRGAAHPIDRDELVVPEAVLLSFDDDLAKAVKPLFDAIWNAAGYAQSKNFSRDGEWLGT